MSDVDLYLPVAVDRTHLYAVRRNLHHRAVLELNSKTIGIALLVRGYAQLGCGDEELLALALNVGQVGLFYFDLILGLEVLGALEELDPLGVIRPPCHYHRPVVPLNQLSSLSGPLERGADLQLPVLQPKSLFVDVVEA